MSRAVIFRSVAVLGLAVVLVACESLEAILNPPPPPVTVGLTVRPADSTLRVGQSVRLIAEAEYEDGSIEEVRAQWLTSSEAVSVDPHGVVTVNAVADAVVVWASFRNQQARATLTTLPACSDPVAGGVVDVRVTGLEVVQVVDIQNRGLPLAAGKDVLVRALVERSGDADVSSLPLHVTVAVSRGGEDVGTVTSQVGCGEITNDLTSLASTFNAVVPTDWLGADLGLVVTAHLPAGLHAGAASQLRYPAVGSLDFDFVEPAPLDITFVPIVLDVAAAEFDDDGAVDAMAWPREVLPLDVVNVDVRAPYTLSIPSADESAEGRVLQELRELRLLDGASGYYHGILPPDTPEAWSAGRGYIRIPVAVSTQYETGRVSGSIVAHELGHNFSLRHAPCGAAALPDDDYPYPDGVIGVYGYGPRFIDHEVVLHTPDTADLMGYCWPQWISDFAYEKVLEFRALEASSVTVANAVVPSTTVLVSGSVGGAEGAVLRPLFVTSTEPAPPAPGQWRFELQSGDGAVLLSVQFDAADVGGAEAGDARDFAFTISIPTSDLARAATARVVSAAGEVLTELYDDLEHGEVRPMSAPRVTREAGGGVVIEWDAETYPAVVVVDRASGTVVGRGAGGRARVSNVGPELELVLSSGLRSVSVIVPVR